MSDNSVIDAEDTLTQLENMYAALEFYQLKLTEALNQEDYQFQEGLKSVIGENYDLYLASVKLHDEKAEIIKTKHADKLDEIKKDIAKLSEQLKADVISLGKTIKGHSHTAVFVKGRVSWDTKALDGMACIIKEINTAKRVGEPTVQIRPITAWSNRENKVDKNNTW